MSHFSFTFTFNIKNLMKYIGLKELEGKSPLKIHIKYVKKNTKQYVS